MAVSNFITSIVVGDDLVPRFSLATSNDLRAATLSINDPVAHGLDHSFHAESVLGMTARRDQTQRLGEMHATLRDAACTAQGRLFPAGRLIHLSPQRPPQLAEPLAFDELLISRDMAAAHMPQRYLKAIQEATRIDN